MAQAVPRRSKVSEAGSSQVLQRIKEAILIALGGVAIFLLIALWSHHPSDPSWSHTGVGDVVRNHGGIVGAWIADIALYLFGGFAYLFICDSVGCFFWRNDIVVSS